MNPMVNDCNKLGRDEVHGNAIKSFKWSLKNYGEGEMFVSNLLSGAVMCMASGSLLSPYILRVH